VLHARLHVKWSKKGGLREAGGGMKVLFTCVFPCLSNTNRVVLLSLLPRGKSECKSNMEQLLPPPYFICKILYCESDAGWIEIRESSADKYVATRLGKNHSQSLSSAPVGEVVVEHIQIVRLVMSVELMAKLKGNTNNLGSQPYLKHAKLNAIDCNH